MAATRFCSLGSVVLTLAAVLVLAACDGRPEKADKGPSTDPGAATRGPDAVATELRTAFVARDWAGVSGLAQGELQALFEALVARRELNRRVESAFLAAYPELTPEVFRRHLDLDIDPRIFGQLEAFEIDGRLPGEAPDARTYQLRALDPYRRQVYGQLHVARGDDGIWRATSLTGLKDGFGPKIRITVSNWNASIGYAADHYLPKLASRRPEAWLDAVTEFAQIAQKFGEVEGEKQGG
ncbi:MAG: hypothetical protein R3F20_09355 [Planctomycetota bacterium]